MEMTIDCPGCGAELRVPNKAAGRAARCPTCSLKFTIPSTRDMLEETASHWIEEDFDPSGEVADDLAESSVDETTTASVMAEESDDGPAVGDSSTVTATVALSPAPPMGPPSVEPAAEVPQPDSQVATAVEDTAKTTTPPPPPAILMSRESRDYPTALCRTEVCPYLVVHDCSQSGVLLGFDARWMAHEAFRVSMPVCCAFSGHRQGGDLYARPMVFLDQYRGDDLSTHAMETRYEQRLMSQQHPRELLLATGILDEMNTPFGEPPIYFVSGKSSGHSLSCHTSNESGTLVCKVLVPDPKVAMEWLARVNGMCGSEYEILAADVVSIGSETWLQLPVECRERLAVWCNFEPREQFRIYLNDADFTTKDIGLAGVVVTDRRLIYHKYHHSGSISLDQEARLHIRAENNAARLTLEHSGRMARVGRIHLKEIDRLSETLAAASGLKIETT